MKKYLPLSIFSIWPKNKPIGVCRSVVRAVITLWLVMLENREGDRLNLFSRGLSIQASSWAGERDMFHRLPIWFFIHYKIELFALVMSSIVHIGNCWDKAGSLKDTFFSGLASRLCRFLRFDIIQRRRELCLTVSVYNADCMGWLGF